MGRAGLRLRRVEPGALDARALLTLGDAEREIQSLRKRGAKVVRTEEEGAQPSDEFVAATKAFTLTLPTFEGPLDLLLHLIREHKLDIFDIPIAFVTAEYVSYLERMKELNLDIAGEFLVMAATLAQIKSRLLLPKQEAAAEDAEEEQGDPRADLVRRFPNRITISIEERRPFTLVHAGRLHWIDEHGVSLGAEPKAVAPTVPVITGLSPADLEGHPPSPRVAAGISLLRVLLRSETALIQQISEVDVSRPDGPVLYTVEGVEVRIGAEDWEARLGRLQGVLAQVRAGGEAVSAIDLRFRDQVVLKTMSR